MHKGKLFVISGASGVGKSTVLSQVMASREDLRFSVSATTRKPRPGEQDGVHYYFVSKETFQKMIAEDAFLEYDDHMDNFYGTPKEQLEEKLEKGHVILDIEPNGAFNVRKTRPDAVLIFIAPPSLEDLKVRLSKRGDTSAEQMAIRLERAQWETQQGKKYDYFVVNHRVEDCAREILEIIAQEADK
ncbi:MAG: guanylate kinase [Oscillospiraceae bacterium]|nr:guanylate kinase [Oscillospiraceae bacterium]